MSEKITINADMPKGYRRLVGLELNQAGDDISASGIMPLGEGKNKFLSSVSLKYDPLEMWGYPNDDQPTETESEAEPEAESKISRAAAKVGDIATLAAATIKDKVTPASAEVAAEPSEPEIGNESGDAEPELPADLREFIRQEVQRQVEIQVVERTKELQERNDQLEAENKALEERVKQLENELDLTKEAAVPAATEATVAADEVAAEVAAEHEPAIVEETVTPVEATPADPVEETELVEEVSPADPPRQSRWRRFWAAPTVAMGNVVTGVDREGISRGRAIGAVILAAVGGAIAWDLYEQKTMGHSPSRELRHYYQDQFSQLKIQEAKDHAAEVKLSNAHNTEQLKAIKNLRALVVTDHNHDLKGMHGILRQVHQTNVHEHREALGGHGGYDHHHGLHGTGKTTEASLSYRGDAVEKEVTKSLKLKGLLTNLSPAKQLQRIHAATSSTLRLNHDRWSGGGPGVDAHKMPIGYQFKMPDFARMFKR